MSGFEPGFLLGHYRIVRALGSGGMADVYEAHDDNLDRTVALKVLPMEYVRNPQLVQRFQKEVRAAAKLNHRNIVTVFEVGQQDSWHFFSMRLLTGGDLRKRIEAGLTPLESLAILREVADAFAHAHARGFVHRDVKPENIMFDEQGFPVLTDFGIAKALDANTHMTRTGMTMGTPRYLSPEQASGKPVDARADLYSLGIILHEMLTGRPPYDAEESMAVIFKHVTEPIPTLPPDFLKYQPLLEKLMAKDANQRIASAADLIKEIDALVPRNPTAELRQSQLRTTENPLIAGLLTPSPLRTPAPRTPPPLTPRPDKPATKPMTVPPLSGEVVVRPPPAKTKPPAPPAARPQTVRPAPPPAPEEPDSVPVPASYRQEPAAAPARKVSPMIGAVVGVVALAAAGAVAFLALKPASTSAPALAPVAAPPQADPNAAARQKERQEAAQREQLRIEQEREAAARRKADADALARKQADDEAARRAASDAEAKRQADAAAKAEAQRKAAADAEARRQAEAQRKAAADAEARRQAEAQRRAAAEAEAQRKAAAEAEAKRESDGSAASRAEEIERAAREADRQRAAQGGGSRAPSKDEARAEAARKRDEERARRKQESEEKAEDRSTLPTGF